MTIKNKLEGEISPEKIPYTQEVWIIDDDASMLEDLDQLLVYKMNDAGYEVRHFVRAQEAIDELNSRPEQGLGSPRFILMDGELGDKEAISHGPEAIVKIQEISNIRQPEFLSFSTDPDLQKAMEDLGATNNFSKQDIDKIAEYMLKQIKAKE